MRTGLPNGWRRWAIGALSVVTAVVVVLTLTGRMPDDGPARAVPSASGPAALPAPSVLDPADPDVPAPDDAEVARLLTPLLAQPALGPGTGAAVVDVASGEALFGRDAATPGTPASTAKLLTAAAALELLGPDHRLRTRVVAGAGPASVVLVGGGDPTLSARTGTGPDAPASLRALARQTATALRAGGVSRVALGYDDSLFAPPRTAPQWPEAYVTSGVVAPVTALTVDEARSAGPGVGTAPRVSDPSAAAARAFAAALAAEGVTVTGAPVRARAPAQPSSSAGSPAAGTPSAGSPAAGAAPTPPAPGAVLGTVQSPTLASLVAWTLSTSDNDLAEALAHHVAIAAGETADFAGGARAATAAVGAMGLPVAGLRLYDGSGLAPATRARPDLLTGVLVQAARADRPDLRPILTGLSVAGFDGTLEDRFDGVVTRGAAGLVRGKTGTLTGVSALAGTVLDADGRLLAFAFLADAAPAGAVLETRAALDRMAAALATCGCRSAVPSTG